MRRWHWGVLGIVSFILGFGLVAPVIIDKTSVELISKVKDDALRPLGAEDTGFHFPTAGGDTYSDFISPTNVYAFDDAGATANDGTKDQQDYYDFEDGGTDLYVSISDGATITGIEVVIRAQKTAGVTPDIDVTLTGDDFATTSSTYSNTFTASYSNLTYGGSSNLWGTSWSKSNFSNTNFRIYLYIPDVGDRDALIIDYVKVKVHYNANSNPINSNPYPDDAATGIPLTPSTLNITVADVDDPTQNMDITFRTNESGTWKDADTNTSVNNGTYYCLNTSWVDTYSTKYWWSVNTTDSYVWDNDTYSFTTEATPGNNNPVNSVPSPVNESTGISLNTNLGITVNDSNADTMNQTFRTNTSGSWADIAWNNNTNNASLSNSTTGFDSYGTEYWWSSNLSDGNSGWDNDTYSFTTKKQKILILHKDDATKANGFETWKEANSVFDCEVIDVDTGGVVIGNSLYYVNGTWGDNTSGNPYYVSQTISNYELYNTSAHQIRNYIRFRVNGDSLVRYIILMGGASYFPYHQNFTFVVSGDKPCDLYFFGALTGTQNKWDNQTDYGIYSEEYGGAYTDMSPDVIVSRMPFDYDSDWTNMSNKFQHWNDNITFGIHDTNFLLYDNLYNMVSESESDQDTYNDVWMNYLSKYTPMGCWEDMDIINIPNSTISSTPLTYSVNYTETNDGTIYEYINGTNATFPDGFGMYLYYTHTDNQFDQLSEYGQNIKTNLSDKDYLFADITSNCEVGDYFWKYFNYYDGPLNDPSTARRHFPIEQIKCEGGAYFAAACSFISYSMQNRLIDNLNEVYSEEQTLGESIVAAEVTFASEFSTASYLYDHIKGLNLFGDPTLKIKYPPYVAICNPRPTEHYETEFKVNDYPENDVNLSCDINDFDSNSLTVRFLINNGSGYTQVNEWTTASNGHYYYDASAYYDNNGTKYWWGCSVYNGTAWFNETWSFYTSITPEQPIYEFRYFRDLDTLTPTLKVLKKAGADITWYHNDSGTWKEIQQNTTSIVICLMTNTTFIDTWNETYEIIISSYYDNVWWNHSRYITAKNTYNDTVTNVYYPNSPTTCNLSSTGSPHHDQIDDPLDSADSATTQLYTLHGTSMFDANFDDATSSDDTIEYLQCVIQVNSTPNNDGGGYTFKTNQTDYYDSLTTDTQHINEFDGLGWHVYNLNFTVNPYNGNAWAWDDIDNFKVNITLEHGKNTEANISQVLLVVHVYVSWQEFSGGYLTGGNNTVFQGIFDGYLTGGNITVFNELYDGYLTGGNVTDTFTEIHSGYLTGGNTTTDFVELFSGYLTGGDDSQYEEILSGWLIGGNITTIFSEFLSGWLTGGNITTFYSELFSGYLTGGDDSQYEEILSGYLTGGNITGRSWKETHSGWLTGGNVTDTFTEIHSGYLTGGNTTTDFVELFSGYLTGGDDSQYESLFDGYLTGGNTTVLPRYWEELLSGWLTGGNTNTTLFVSNENPVNESSMQSGQPILYFTLTNPLGDTMNYSIYIGNSTQNTTYLLTNATGVSNGTFYYSNYSNATEYGTNYYWRIYVEDGTTIVNETFHFILSFGSAGYIIGGSNAGVIAFASASLLFFVVAMIVFRRRRKEQ